MRLLFMTTVILRAITLETLRTAIILTDIDEILTILWTNEECWQRGNIVVFGYKVC